jgi:N6-adenosine-specific RNA methylase IME4
LGRRPIGRKAMTPAQRQKRYRRNLRPNPTKLKQKRRQAREAELAAATIKASQELGSELYGVLYADPPWDWTPWSRETGMDRAAANHYPTMAVDEIKAVTVPAAKDCVLFLWAVPSMLPEALAVIDAWGFVYRTSYAWKKPRAGTGYWARFTHEYLLVATRGTVPAPAPGTQWEAMLEPLVIEAPVTEHSQKPAAFAEMIEHYFPTTPKLEMFARGAGRPGWDRWGNEVVAGPKRFQRRRIKGWRKPDGGIIVDRSTRWGNPFEALDKSLEEATRVVAGFEAMALDPDRADHYPTITYPAITEMRRELRGRDLGCWCPLDRPCHADVLLKIANQED